MHEDLERVLIPEQELLRRVRQMGQQIAATYQDSPHGLVIVPILSGSIIFLADLIRCLPFKMRIALMAVSSYRGATTQSSGPRTTLPLSVDVAGRDVLIVDDILDTGGTLRYVAQEIRAKQPASVRLCVLLRKPSRAPADLVPDFVGFDIEDAWVVGYGLDYNDLYRNWPHIAVLRRELH